MGEIGVCVNIKGLDEGLWSVDDLVALGITNGWIRTPIQGSLNMLESLSALPTSVKVLVMLNNECDEVRHNWSGWEDAVRTLAERFGGRVNGVACGNELDLFEDTPPEFAASLVRQARPILLQAGIPTIASSVTSGNWVDYLERLVDACGIHQPDFYDCHFYGKGFDDVPQNPYFRSIEEGIDVALARTRGRPLVLSEGGVKRNEIGFDAGQAIYARRWVQLVRSMPSTRVAFATYFALYDEVGTDQEQGDRAFGLISAGNLGRQPREAFGTFRDALL